MIRLHLVQSEELVEVFLHFILSLDAFHRNIFTFPIIIITVDNIHVESEDQGLR